MDSSVSHIVGHDTTAFITIHQKVHGEVFDEKDTIISQGSTEKGVKHGMTCSVGHCAASVSLTSLSKVGGLSTEGSLVDLAFASSTERHTVRFKFSDSEGSLSCHILNGVLVTKPVRALDCIVEMVSPVIFVHIAQCSIDSSLSSNSVRSSREELGDASSLETSFRQAEGSS